MKKTVSLLLLGGSLAAIAPFAGAAPATPPPNIVVLFADDLGWKDVGLNGATFYETPNIDRLAREGLVFSNAYSGGSNCAPSRAALWSGQYAPRTGVHAVGTMDRPPHHLQRLVPLVNRETLPAESVTLAEALRAGGYRTGLFGKWHLGAEAPFRPEDQGFDAYFDPRAVDPNRERNEPDNPKGIYTTTRAALKFIEQDRERPFFVFLSYHAIHSVLEYRPATLERFKDKERTDPGQTLDRYAASIYDLDDVVGIVLARLEALGLAENTLVIFTSDNGATRNSAQEPLRGNKGSFYEGGVRVPFIVRWPGRTTAGTESSVPIINLDLYPTFLAATGVPEPKEYALDGENLLPLFGNPAQTLKREAIFWHFPGYLHTPVFRGRDQIFRTRPVSVVRQGDWKLHLYHEEWVLDGGRAQLDANRAVELYNLAKDPGERVDLATTETAKRDELLNVLFRWMNETSAKMPWAPNPNYDPTQSSQ